MKYRTKPVKVEALQYKGAYTGDGADILTLLTRSGHWAGPGKELTIYGPLQSETVVYKGEWVVKTRDNNFTVLNDEAFKSLYVAVVG
ncbi:hypothetical protein CB3_100 [Pectobacterium phage vB_PatP_CB3]|uniref:Uncharacterized protein n=3 Tax=Cbunavirus TaxID=2842586 RepID=A0A2P0PAT9_9CAUD|nr:hypothetical protein HWB08_gp94 [Pectobacterium phage vB_PatP_CB1]YP_009832427.1 hypothetical protein HWB09_gp094 [Pectobacterium phage vB_PatP_CB4]AQT27940.1 hypothetical protein CB4_98 [Pectobacterium phage vB_PatP_CB4]ARB11821.1 hypothetical protein CB1_94 [Pectobacterium phage vB_PatP_CB1]ARB11924.1 hypothetical protein CB3_100 [Pectobacterium phage vB_PatP_CB3]